MTVDFARKLDALFAKVKADRLRTRSWERYSALGLPKQPSLYGFPLVPTDSTLTCSVPALPLRQALNKFGSYLSGRWNKEELDPFAALNGALHDDGLFLYLTESTCEPICIDLGGALHPRIHIFVAENASVDLRITRSSCQSWSNSLIDIALEENASCTLHQRSSFLGAMRVTQKANSRLTYRSVARELMRSDLRISLEGENASCELEGAWDLHDRSQAHTNVLVQHHAPHCCSRQHFRGVLDDQAQSFFEGKIWVAPEAQKTDAFQLNKNLLLSPRASAHSRPNLEIFADDVKASHGATTGQLDPEQLFYLRTRGFDPKSAKQLLVQGFLAEITDKIDA